MIQYIYNLRVMEMIIMIRELKATVTEDLMHFVDRFAMYDDVFTEYINTLQLIDEGKTLMFENFQMLSRNYRKNVQVFASESLRMMRTLQVKLDAQSLHKIARDLSEYINELNNVFTCVDLNDQSVNYVAHEKTILNIKNAKSNLCYSIQEISFK